MKTIIFTILTIVLASCATDFGKETRDKKKEILAKRVSKHCFVGDTGTGKEDQYKVAKAMENEGCEAIYIAGDVVYEVGLWKKNSKAWDEKFAKPFKSLMGKAHIYLSLGNHDHYGRESLFFSHAQKHSTVYFPNYFYRVKYPDLCVTMLDTNKGFDSQVKWLNETHSKSGCLLDIVVSHHPLKSQGSHGNASGELEDFLETTYAHGFTVHVGGHDHHLSYEGQHISGTHMFISGAGAKLRDYKAMEKGTWGESTLGFLVYEGRVWRFIDVQGREIWSLNAML